MRLQMPRGSARDQRAPLERNHQAGGVPSGLRESEATLTTHSFQSQLDIVGADQDGRCLLLRAE